MSLFGKKTWRVQDIVRTDGGKEVLSILKISHPFRKQRIVVVPAPAFAQESYYTDWVYQPYAKEHRMFVSNDIFNPTYVYLARILIRRGIFPGYAYFHPMGFPDCVDLNLSRREFIAREQPLKTPMPLLLLTPNLLRQNSHPWIARRVLNIVGEQYVTHPREEHQSMMFILPPAYVPSAVNTLQSLGFQVTDHTTAVAGEVETLQKLNRWSDIAQLVALGYIWFMALLFIVNESRRVESMFQDYKREMVEKAGKDPAKMGL
ncbi:putative trans-sialidase [Trypanosoma theileri]|uniref:Putative trans-sialidase n=1 Tax=Trypanosoma theileri TaxID=67003 RepID=A0A1X0ND76_9TRYP|nr:putative trans-sialidase [Trypanosoma theileri]ORC76712.1 putative trans-sialidase [Trypanosoma theileri]